MPKVTRVNKHNRNELASVAARFSTQQARLSTENAVNESVFVSPCPGWKSGTIVYALYHTLGALFRAIGPGIPFLNPFLLTG